MSDPAWAPFVGLGVFVAFGVVALSRASAAAVTDETGAGAPAEPAATPAVSPTALLVNVALSQGVVGALLLAAAWLWSIPLSALGLGPADVGTTALAVGVGAGVVLSLGNEVLSFVCEWFGVPYSEALRETLSPETVRGWAVLLGLVLPLVAGVEELLFRGVLVGVVAAGFGVSPWLLAVLSSVLFGAAHTAQGGVGVAVAALLGFALAAVYVLSGSLFVVVVAHYLVNAVEFLAHEEWHLRGV
ncbi:CPBP family intramembrane glutamic endopeptidase [Halospeciosus flavus]|uniref:CPBP family intramembrane glutamic endopeptidase n=1 Tax=Halospeciosus flavus TaxID=3032283 RepID=A0ABD5Z5L0_9EURY|nr:CPBP family intramembrane glutamic endopeptidase [Halospeciosus flavus]